ncbi:MAG: ParA family protein [Candidatus Puniceispirillales bacterium WSBS_2018_MAG_OTU23]
MLVVFGSTKGGTGKTTAALILAGELAQEGLKTIVIDADPRQPMVAWANMPNKPKNITVISCFDENAILDKIKKAKLAADAVIVDLEGRASRISSYAMSQADLVVIAAKEQHQDAAAAVKLIAEIKLDEEMLERPIPHIILLTQTRVVAKSRTSRFIGQEIAENPNMPCLNAEINERDAFSAIFSIGGTIHGFKEKDVNNLAAAKKNAKAVAEEIINHAKENKNAR